MDEIIIMGRPYIFTIAKIKKTKKGYIVKMPEDDLNRVVRDDNETIALVYITRASVVNLLEYGSDDPIWARLPEEARKELYYQGLDPQRKPRGRIVFIAAEEDEVKALGLDPDKPIALKDVIKKIKPSSASNI